MDIYVSVDCGDRNGFRFLAGFTMHRRWDIFIQPMQVKSGAAVALEAFYHFLCDNTVRTEVEHFSNSTPGFIKEQFGLRHD